MHDQREHEPQPVRDWIRTTQFAGSLALAALVVGGFGIAVLTAAPVERLDSEPVIEVSAPRATPAGASAVVSEAGVYETGSDIRPGRWSTAGPARAADVGVCSWERSTSGTGDLADVMANATVRGSASLYADRGEWITVSGPCVWRHVGQG